ncbi:DUF1566 domain-containing protein [Thermodesulfobacteriota bacterium]
MISTLKSIGKSTLFLLPIMFLFSDAAICAEKKKYISLNSVVSKIPTTVQPYSISKTNRFLDNQDGTVTDLKTNLMWIKNGWRIESLSAITWFEAINKCQSLKYRNYGDWRLPTVEEWKSILDTNNRNPALIEPNPFVNIVTHMPYWSMTEFIYGNNYTCNRICPFDSYTVVLYSGSIGHQRKTERAFILPVRSIK